MNAPISSAAAALTGAASQAADAPTRDAPRPSAFKRFVRDEPDQSRDSAPPRRDAPEAKSARRSPTDAPDRQAEEAAASEKAPATADAERSDPRPSEATQSEPAGEDIAASEDKAASEDTAAADPEMADVQQVPLEPAPLPTTSLDPAIVAGLADGEAQPIAPALGQSDAPETAPEAAALARMAAPSGPSRPAPTPQGQPAEPAEPSDQATAPVAATQDPDPELAFAPDLAGDDAPALTSARNAGPAASATPSPTTPSTGPDDALAIAASAAEPQTAGTPPRSQIASAVDSETPPQTAASTATAAAAARPGEPAPAVTSRSRSDSAREIVARTGHVAEPSPAQPAEQPPAQPAQATASPPTDRAVDASDMGLAGRPQAAPALDDASLAPQPVTAPTVETPAPDTDAAGRLAPPPQFDPSATEAADARLADARPADAASQLAARRFASAMSQQQPTAQVAFSIARNALEARDRIRMQLYPQELGKVEVTMDVQDDRRVEVVVRAERPETMELLQKDARELQRALQNAGLDVGAGDLSFEFGGQTADQDGDGDGKSAKGADGDDADVPSDRLQPPPAPRWRVATPGGVDLVA